MSKRRMLLRASAAAAAAAFAAAAMALDPLAFVAGWPIEAPADAKVFDVPLTAEVYAASQGIEQLAVLDANGEPQAFFRRSPPSNAPTERRVVLEASPLYEGGAAMTPSVGVTTGQRGTTVTVTPGSASSTKIVGFVLDAREVEVAPSALELDWRALPQPFLLDVAVEQSEDLTHWRGVGRASVAALSVGGTEARHARVPVRAGAGGYLRVTASGAVADWQLLRATLISVATEPAMPLSVRIAPLSADAAPVDGPPGALYFDAGGPLPVSTVTLAFGDNDGWVQAEVAAARSLEGPWIPVARRALIYALSFEGREFTSDALAVGRHEARYWRVVPAAPPRGERLMLVLEFPQESLRVAAGGGAPYLLAAGTLADEAGPDATLASVWSRLDPPAPAVPAATLGPRRELGGAAALVAPRVFPWRTAALWGVLLLGVLVVGTMAVRLAKEMQKPST
jgi:uncharacterized protein DUF3999